MYNNNIFTDSLTGAFSDGCFLDGCFLDGCFLDGCFLDGCLLDDPIFADFEQVKSLLVILLALNNLKKLTIKLPCEKLDAYASFFSFFGHGLMSPALHPGFSDLLGSPPALSSTSTLGFF